MAYVIVNEAGASVYSTSRIGREEFPNYDATLRGAISIGRRLQDPLSELVKIDPANIGVGMYQHDVKAKHLRDSLDAVVESCVNYVGRRSEHGQPRAAALRVGPQPAHGPAALRLSHGATARSATASSSKAVSGFGESTFVQAAGFLKIVGGDNPLDATWIHPESYAATVRSARQARRFAGGSGRQASGRRSWPSGRPSCNVDQLAGEVQIGQLTLSDVLAQLQRPGRDPRESLPPPIFKRGMLKLEDLHARHGAGRHGAERGRLRGVHRYRAQGQRAGAHQPIGQSLRARSARGGFGRRYCQGLGPGSRQAAAPRLADDDRAGHAQAGRRPPRSSESVAQKAAGRRGRQRRLVRGEQTGNAVAGNAQRQCSAGSGSAPAGQPPRPRFRKPPPAHMRPAGQQHEKPVHAKSVFKPKPKPKPVVPLTKDMKEGKAPLRTFGDLQQFWQLKHTDSPDEQQEPVDEPT